MERARVYPARGGERPRRAPWCTIQLIAATTTAAALQMTRILVRPGARASLDDYGSIVLDL